MVCQAGVPLGGTSFPLSRCQASAWSASVMATGFVLFSVLIITLFFFVVSVVVPSITVFYTIIHELQPESTECPCTTRRWGLWALLARRVCEAPHPRYMYGRLNGPCWLEGRMRPPVGVVLADGPPIGVVTGSPSLLLRSLRDEGLPAHSSWGVQVARPLRTHGLSASPPDGG